MHIWILTQYYPPEPGAPQARLSEMAAAWKKRGADVTVLTGFPNHPDGRIPPEYRGRIFAREERDGIRVWRHWLYATPNRGFFKKVLGHLSFMASTVVLSLFRGTRPDVIVVSSPTFFSVWSAYVFSRVRRAPFVFEVRDLWPGIFIELGVLKNRFLIRVLEAMELFLYRRARAVVAVTERFREDIKNRGIAAEKCFVVTNGADLSRFGPGEPDRELRAQSGAKPGDVLVLYAGAHGISHALSTVLEAARIIAHGGEPLRFLFVGDGAEKPRLVERAKRENLENVTFLPPVAKQRMPGLYRAADVVLVPLRNIPGFRSFIPSKMFEILACERPVLASLEGEAAAILERSGGAVVVPPEDPGALVEALRALARDEDRRTALGKNGRAFVAAHFDREKLAERYLEILRSLAGEPGGSPANGKGAS